MALFSAHLNRIPRKKGREEGGAAKDEPLFVYRAGSPAEGNINFE